jgi:hypothetical protein
MHIHLVLLKIQCLKYSWNALEAQKYFYPQHPFIPKKVTPSSLILHLKQFRDGFTVSNREPMRGGSKNFEVEQIFFLFVSLFCRPPSQLVALHI